MLIYNSKIIQLQVQQHPYLNIFYIYLYGWCDNPRSYSQHYDWYCHKVVNNINDLNTIVRRLECLDEIKNK